MKKERFLVGNLFLSNTKCWFVQPVVIANRYLFFWCATQGEVGEMNHLTKAKKWTSFLTSLVCSFGDAEIRPNLVMPNYGSVTALNWCGGIPNQECHQQKVAKPVWGSNDVRAF